MGIRKKQSPSSPAHQERQKVRLVGDERLLDVCRTLFGDDRLLPLLMDLNPGVPHGPVPEGTIVELPTAEEVRRFASKMGFNLGFDPSKPRGTQVQNNWKKMKGEAQAAVAIDPHEMLAVLERQGLDPETAARRLEKLVGADAMAAFLEEPGDSEAAQAIAKASKALGARGRLRRILKALSTMLDTACRPAGRRALLEAAVNEPEAAQAVLAALLVPEPVRKALGDAAAYAVPHLKKADVVAQKDKVLRNAELDAMGTAEGVEVFRALVMALVDGVPILGGDRPARLGIDGVLNAWEKHAEQVASLLKRLIDALEGTPADVLIAVDTGAEAELPRPWPLAASLIQRLGSRALRVHAGQQELGVAAMIAEVKPGDGFAESMLSAAELAARAAANARAAEEHDEIPGRLATSMVLLFDRLRPSARDTGSEGQQKQRRRSRVEHALLVARDMEVDPSASVAVVDELLGLAPKLADGSSEERAFKRRLRQLPAGAKTGCRELAASLAGPVPALLRNASPVARGLLAVAVALDDELGQGLGRSSGREAARELLEVHATRAITLCIQRYVQGDARAEVHRH